MGFDYSALHMIYLLTAREESGDFKTVSVLSGPPGVKLYELWEKYPGKTKNWTKESVRGFAWWLLWYDELSEPFKEREFVDW